MGPPLLSPKSAPGWVACVALTFPFVLCGVATHIMWATQFSSDLFPSSNKYLSPYYVLGVLRAKMGRSSSGGDGH